MKNDNSLKKLSEMCINSFLEGSHITKELLSDSMPGITEHNLRVYLPILQVYLIEYNINTPLRVAHFLAQIGHESQSLNYTRENLNYSAAGLLKTFKRYFTIETAKKYARNPEKIANKVYANRYGNGPEDSGDGWRYRGGGGIGLTFKDNYYNASQFLFGDERLSDYPMQISEPINVIRVSIWFWITRNLNNYADKDDLLGGTKAINGGTNGYKNRAFRLSLAKKSFGI